MWKVGKISDILDFVLRMRKLKFGEKLGNFHSLEKKSITISINSENFKHLKICEQIFNIAWKFLAHSLFQHWYRGHTNKMMCRNTLFFVEQKFTMQQFSKYAESFRVDENVHTLSPHKCSTWFGIFKKSVQRHWFDPLCLTYTLCTNFFSTWFGFWEVCADTGITYLIIYENLYHSKVLNSICLSIF